MIFKKNIYKNFLKARRYGLSTVSQCNTCERYYCNDIAPDQAYYCEAFVWFDESIGKYVITGNYGSTVADMEKLIVLNKAGIQDGRICDACLKRLLKNESIVYDADYNPKQEWMKSIKDSNPVLYKMNVDLEKVIMEKSLTKSLKKRMD